MIITRIPGTNRNVTIDSPNDCLSTIGGNGKTILAMPFLGSDHQFLIVNGDRMHVTIGREETVRAFVREFNGIDSEHITEYILERWT